MPHPLADKRSLEVRVRGLARIIERLGELERALDVFTRCFVVPLAPVAARAPAEDVRAQPVARQLGALSQGQRLVEEIDRGRNAGKLVAANGHAKEEIRAVDIRKLGRLGEHPRPVEQLDRLLDLAVLHSRPRLAGKLSDFELGDTRRKHGALAVLVLGDRLFVAMRLG